MNTLRNILILSGLLFTAVSSNAAHIASPTAFVAAYSDDPCSKTGPDEQEAKMKFSLYREFFKQDNFVDAFPHWRFVYNNAPGLSKNTFINGAKLYSHFADAETDTVLKQALVDTLIMVYRKRIECFGEADKVLGYLAYDMYKYRPERHQFVYGLFREALNEGEENTDYYLLYPLFQYTTLLWRKQEMSDDDVLTKYDRLIRISDINIRAAEEAGDEKLAENWRGTKTKIDEILPRGLLTCEKLVARLERDRESVFADLNELKKAYNSLKLAPADSVSGARCSDQPIFTEIVMSISEMEPSATLLNEVGEILWKQGNSDGAVAAWNKSIEMETDPERRASLSLTIAKVYQRDKQFVRSREWARKALSFRPNWGEPYILIGDLYASSGSICEGRDSELAALPALDKYAQAKAVDPASAAEAQERINKYSNYLPTKTYLFERTMNEGDSYTFSCWIGETTILRGKKSN